MKGRLGLAMTVLAASTFAAVLSMGCVVTPPPGAVFVRTAPPVGVVEVQGIAPGPGFVWIPGFHRWDGASHVWVSGRWEKAPRVGAVWEPGVWRHHSKGWYWTEGRWR
jgi:hypothetical protein